MDDFLSRDKDDLNNPKQRPYSPQKPRNSLLERLKLAKAKLAPIIYNVRTCSENRLGRSRCRMKTEPKTCAITKDQYKEVLFASELLQNIDFNLIDRDDVYEDIELPNTDVIIANVDLEYEATKLGKSKTIVLDGGVLKEIVDLYKQLGEAIGRLIIEANSSNTDQTKPSFENMARSSEIAMPDSQAGMQPDATPSKSGEVSTKASKASAESTSGAKLGDSLSRMISQNKVMDGPEVRDKSTPESDPAIKKSKTTFEDSKDGSDSKLRSISPKNLKDAETSSNDVGKGSNESNRSKSAIDQKSVLSPPKSTISTRSKSVPKTNSVKMSDSTNDIDSKSEQFISKTPSKARSRNAQMDDDEKEGVIYITIKCFSDMDDTGNESDYTCIPICETSCPSGTDGSMHVHVKVDGNPVTVKVNQERVTNDGLYCINAGNDDDDNIKIMLKKCPECCSAVLASSAKIESVNEFKPPTTDRADSRDLGDSHESVTLHGKTLNEDNETVFEAYSDDDMPTKLASDQDDGGSESKKMNILLDRDQISRSIIEFDQDKDPTRDNKTDLPQGQSTEKIPSDGKKEVAPKQSIRLTRGKICSSLEFDVTVVETRMRTEGIDHPNAGIVVNLKELGVNQLLRACRPAKCCRKAILDEKNRVALPYAVSLKSLPLVPGDIGVIEQSIDMSVKKIKNSINLTQDLNSTMAYYVSLGQNDFKSNINFPWVLPSYDIKCVAINSDSLAIEEAKSRYFLLKKIQSDDEKFYVLKKVQEGTERTNKRFFHPYRSESVRKKSPSIRINDSQFLKGPRANKCSKHSDLMECGDGSFCRNVDFKGNSQMVSANEVLNPFDVFNPLQNIDLDFVLGRTNHLRNQKVFPKTHPNPPCSCMNASTSTASLKLGCSGDFQNLIFAAWKPHQTNFIVGMFTSEKPVPPHHPKSMHNPNVDAIQLEEWAPHLVSVTSLPRMKEAKKSKCKTCRNASVGTSCRAVNCVEGTPVARSISDILKAKKRDEVQAKPPTKREDPESVLNVWTGRPNKDKNCRISNTCDRKIRIEIERRRKEKESGNESTPPSSPVKCSKEICRSRRPLDYDARGGKKPLTCHKGVCEIYNDGKTRKCGKNLESRFTLTNSDSLEILIDKSCVKVQKRNRDDDNKKQQRRE